MDINLKRLAKAVHLDVERAGESRYLVFSFGHSYIVDLKSDEPCHCADYAIRGVVCAHILACRMLEGDVEVLRSLRAITPLPQARRLIRAA